MLHTDKRRKFDLLIENVNRCNLCSRMQGRTKVLSEKNGNIDSKVMFIGEAPGRLGADRTGIPFFGDKAGANFERLLQFAGLARQQVFITNAVLCNPRDEKGNNSPPNKTEIQNCSLHLSILIDIIEPEFIVPLGQCALRSLHIINEHQIELRQVRKLAKWGKYTVMPMYHPGSRASIYRSIADQKGDFSFLGEILGLPRTAQKLL
ncbi:MAG TPA: uracil-DNA glycosylase [Dehalococcoidales bacterium]